MYPEFVEARRALAHLLERAADSAAPEPSVAAGSARISDVDEALTVYRQAVRAESLALS